MRNFLFFLCLLPNLASANDWDVLRAPGAIAIMRHALAPGTSDPANFRLDDCGTQRNLNDAGRARARKTGAILREQRVIFDAVYTSQWCHSHETAELLDLGVPVDIPSLNSFFGGRGDRIGQTQETRKALTGMTGLVILVTHQCEYCRVH